jgi:DNA-binding transcriptional regulator YhcF (GntR family)
VARAKIQLKGQFVISRDRSRPLSLQIVGQLQEAIETDRLVRGTGLPSTGSLARTLGVSRNTVLTAYEELVSRGLLRSRRGAGMYVSVPVGLSGFNLKAIVRRRSLDEGEQQLHQVLPPERVLRFSGLERGFQDPAAAPRTSLQW